MKQDIKDRITIIITVLLFIFMVAVCSEMKTPEREPLRQIESD